jgi:hypothetical protein
MIELADAFIALPGGIGTIEELMEVWTMNQLSEIDKPVGLLNSRVPSSCAFLTVSSWRS